jgi:hypothetical protein
MTLNFVDGMKKFQGSTPPPLSLGSYCHWGEDEALTSCKDVFKCHCLTKKYYY